MVVPRELRTFGCIHKFFVAGLLASLAVSSGCQSAAGTGAATGGLLGFGLGELLGHRPGIALAGAALGAAAGTVAGAGVDIARDKKAQRNAQAAAMQTAATAPTLTDIVTMTQNAVPPAQIVEQIRTSGVVYRLSAQNIIDLNHQGVNSQVIQALQDTALRPAYSASPMIVEQPVTYVAPAPVVGVGYGWGPRWR